VEPWRYLRPTITAPSTTPDADLVAGKLPSSLSEPGNVSNLFLKDGKFLQNGKQPPWVIF